MRRRILIYAYSHSFRCSAKRQARKSRATCDINYAENQKILQHVSLMQLSIISLKKVRKSLSPEMRNHKITDTQLLSFQNIYSKFYWVFKEFLNIITGWQLD